MIAFTLAWRTVKRNGLTLYVNISLPSWYVQLLLILVSAIYSTYMLLVIPGDCREHYPSQYGFCFVFNCVMGYASVLVWGAFLLFFFSDWGEGACASCYKVPSLVPQASRHCLICLKVLDETVLEASCQELHLYHTDCFFLQNRRVCPLCPDHNYEVEVEDMETDRVNSD